MNRRAFVTGLGVVLAAPLGVGAQQPGKIPRVGFLTAFSPSDYPLWRKGFRQGLRDLGYTEGQNIVVEYRYANGHPERLQSLAAELVHLKMDIIAAETTPANLAVKQATTTIPIVLTLVADPVGSGLVSSLARPGGNITGLSLQLPDIVPKRLQLLREVVPVASRVAILWNSASPITPPQLKAAEVAAPALGMQLESLGVRTPADFERAFQIATRRHVNALLILDDFFLASHTGQLAALAVKSKLPAMAGVDGFAEAGVLINYGPRFADITRRSVTYIDKILKGAKPGDLPIEQPTSFELVINMTTAKTLGLTIPQFAAAAGGSGPRVMHRRGFLAGVGAALIVSTVSAAEQTSARIGVISPVEGFTDVDVLRRELHALGYGEPNIHLEYRSGSDDRFAVFANELVGLPADVIVAVTPPAIRAAQRATTTIPIVMMLSGNPVASGLVQSLAHPGGNTTGPATLTAELGPKRLEIFKDAVGRLRLVAVLFNPVYPGYREAVSQTRAVGQARGVVVRSFEIQHAVEFDGTLAAILRARPDGLIIFPDPLTSTHMDRIVDFTKANRVPAMDGRRQFPEHGGLISYGIDYAQHVRDGLRYVDRILRGAKPANLPIEQPTKFELIINLKTAKALGLTIPPSLLLRADKVLE